MTEPAFRVNFYKRDLTAALDCARKAGIPVRRIEIDGKRLVIIVGEPEEGPAKPPNAFDGAEF